MTVAERCASKIEPTPYGRVGVGHPPYCDPKECVPSTDGWFDGHHLGRPVSIEDREESVVTVTVAAYASHEYAAGFLPDCIGYHVGGVALSIDETAFVGRRFEVVLSMRQVSAMVDALTTVHAQVLSDPVLGKCPGCIALVGNAPTGTDPVG